MARGKHLFPFRTEQLSPSAPMVLVSQGPGRVGRRRFLDRSGRQYGGPPSLWARCRRRARATPAASAAAARRRFGGRGGAGGTSRLGAGPAAAVSGGGERGETGVRGGLRLPGTPARRSAGPPAQRRSMRMIYLGRLLLVDLPVDVVVVLEQQEGAYEAKRTERALPQGGCSVRREHVFVRYDGRRTEALRTYVRIGSTTRIWLSNAVSATSTCNAHCSRGFAGRSRGRAETRVQGPRPSPRTPVERWLLR